MESMLVDGILSNDTILNVEVLIIDANPYRFLISMMCGVVKKLELQIIQRNHEGRYSLHHTLGIVNLLGGRWNIPMYQLICQPICHVVS